MKNMLKNHPLIWIVPLILLPVIIGTIAYLAYLEAGTPDSPFIYDI